jgi:hypothetical protein
MATTAICGTGGSVDLGGEITSWSAQLESTAIEATSMASAGWREYLACLTSASGTFESLTSVGGVGAQTGVTFATGGSASITADIIITDVTQSVDVNGLVTHKYSWVSTGEI